MFLSLNVGEQNYKNYKTEFLITASISAILGVALIVMVVLLLCTRRHQKRHEDNTVYMEPTVPDMGTSFLRMIPWHTLVKAIIT